jgi:hypothetical protein
MRVYNNREVVNGKVKIAIPCPDGIVGCAVAHYKWIPLEEWEDMQELEHLKEQLRFAIPSKRMLEVVNVGAIKLGDELIVLKNRYDFNPIEELMITYDEKHEMGYEYKEILGKSVIFDEKIFGRRGQKAIMDYIMYQETKYCRHCGKRLDRSNNEYHRSWGTCDMYCYADLVGANLHEF